MKTLQFTTTRNLFNHTGILDHAGDYAGKYQDEAYDILEHNEDFKETRFRTGNWADIMYHDNGTDNGTFYAVFAEDSLTCQNAQCIYVEIDENDCPEAVHEGCQKIIHSED